MRYFILTITFALAIISTTNGQQRKVSLSGTVRDSSAGESMVGATVTASATNTTQTQQGAVAGGNGFYNLKLAPGNYEVECSFLGYGTGKQSINITCDTIIDFALPQKTTDIDAVVVVGSGEGVGSRFGKINVSMQQLKYMPLFAGEQDVFKYFQMLPGVVGGREGSSEINIRGGSSDQTLILMDGVPIYNQNHALGFLSIFNGDALSGAELYKSGMPSSIGGRLSGAISMTTRDGDRQTHQQSLTVGTLTLSTLLHGPLKKGKGSYLFSGRYFTPNALLAATTAIAGLTFRPNYMFYDLTGKLTYQLGQRNTIAWSIYNGYDLFSVTAINREYDNIRDQETTFSKSSQSFGWGTTASALKLNTQLPKGMMLTNTIYYSGYMSSFNYNHTDYVEKTWFKSDLRSSLHDVGVSSTLEQKLGVHQLNYGLQASYQLFTPKDVDSYSDQQNSHIRNGNRGMYSAALFFQDNIVNGNWGFQLGLRVPLYINDARNSTSGKTAVATNLEPRLGASYMIGSKNTLFASYDRNSQPLFSLNRTYNGFPIDFLIPMQDDILQKSDQVSLGWKYRPLPSLFFSVETYYKSMRNLYLVRNEDDLLGGRGGMELGDGRSFGGELVAQYTGRSTTIMLSYAQSKSNRLVGDAIYDFQYDIPYNFNLYAKQRVLNRPGRQHYISANMSIKSGVPFVLSNEMYPTPGDNMGSIPDNPLYPNIRLRTYLRLDLNYSMEKQMRRGRRIWQISVLNTTNYFNPFMVYPDGDKFKGISILPIFPSFSYKRFF